MSGQDPSYTCFNTERPSEKRFSDGLCRLSRVCRPKATHAFFAPQQMSAPRKPKNRVRGCDTHPTSAARAVYALWWFTNKERPSETRFSDGLCRLSRVCRPKATHAVADLRKARDSLCGKDRVRGCATHPTQRPSESVFGRSGIYARRFL